MSSNESEFVGISAPSTRHGTRCTPNPGVEVSTTNADTPLCPSVGSVFAYTIPTSATLAFVIHILAPLTTYSSPSRTAVVRIAPSRSEPPAGSDMPL